MNLYVSNIWFYSIISSKTHLDTNSISMDKEPTSGTGHAVCIDRSTSLLFHVLFLFDYMYLLVKVSKLGYSIK